MAQLDTQILPLLPLTSGVVLPGMVVTLTIESDEAQRAIAASESSDGELLLVPRIGSSYAKIGTVAKVEDVGRLRSGLEALVIRGMVRAVVGTGVAGTGETTWVQFEPRPDPDDLVRTRPRALARVQGGAREHRRGARRPRGRRLPARPVRPRSGRRHGRLLAGPVDRAEGRGPRDPRRRAAAREGPGLGQGGPGRARAEGQDPHRRPRRHGEEPARVHPAPADGRDPQGARRRVGRGDRRGVPQEDRRREHARGRPQGGRARARSPRGDVGAVARVRLDPHVPRLDDRDPVGRPHRGQPRDRRGARDPGRGPHRPVRREGPDRRVPRGPQAASGARARTLVRPRLGRDPHAGRASGRRQDVARRVRGAGARSQVRPDLARRDPRRGRDPRAPAHLRRRAAGPHRPCLEGGRHEEPGDDARRGRQGRRRLARRPLERAARGARPGAEPHVPRPLPRGRPRPVRGAVHLDRQRVRDDPGPAARPDGGHPARRLHRGREGRDRARPPARTAGGAQRPAFGRGRDDRRRGPSDRRRLHAGGRRAEPRARARQGAAQGGHPARERSGAGPRSGRRRRRPRVPRAAEVLLRGRRAHERARRRDRARGHRHRRRRPVHRGHASGRATGRTR